MAQMVKNPPAMWEIQIWSLVWKDPLEKGMAITPVLWPKDLVTNSAWGLTSHLSDMKTCPFHVTKQGSFKYVTLLTSAKLTIQEPGAKKKEKNQQFWFHLFLNVHTLIIIFALILNYCLQTLFIKIEGTCWQNQFQQEKRKWFNSWYFPSAFLWSDTAPEQRWVHQQGEWKWKMLSQAWLLKMPF